MEIRGPVHTVELRAVGATGGQHAEDEAYRGGRDLGQGPAGIT